MGIDQAAVEHYRVDLNHALQVRDAALLLFSTLNPCISFRQSTANGFRRQRCCMKLAITSIATGTTAHVLHHREFGDLRVHVTAAQDHRLDRTLSGKVEAYAGDGPMTGLTPDEQENVEKASVLLRIARALNMAEASQYKRSGFPLVTDASL